MSRGDEPAYPVMTEDHYNMHPGMTIREAFTKAAMQGLLSNPAVGTALSDDEDAFSVIAERANWIAEVQIEIMGLAKPETTDAKQSD